MRPRDHYECVPPDTCRRVGPVIAIVGEADLHDLLPLMRAYCDFYEVSPSDDALLAMSRVLIADPEREGVQLIARDASGAAIGYATLFWTWGSLSAARIGVMYDLFVTDGARGQRIGEQLIAACVEQCRRHGASTLTWQTALDNTRAQRLYDRVGARRERWLDYHLPV
jgi:GNAT superfamily N-acetyltransferase